MSALSDSLCTVGIGAQEAANLIAGWTTEAQASYSAFLAPYALEARGYGFLIENFSLSGDMSLGDVKLKDGNSSQVKFWQSKLDAANRALGLTGSKARPLESVIVPLKVYQ